MATSNSKWILATAKWVWMMACIGVLIYLHYPSEYPEDVAVIGGWLLIILAFPVSLILTWVAGGLAYLWMLIGLGETALLFIEWLVFAVGGYVQWFVAIPRILRRLREDGTLG